MIFNKQRFTLWFLGTTAALIALTQIAALFGLNLQNAGTAIIPCMVGSLVEGQKFARVHAAPLQRPWKQAAGMAGITVLINIVLLLLVFITMPDARETMLQYLQYIAATFAVFALIWWVTSWFFYRMGARTVWKAQDAGLE